MVLQIGELLYKLEVFASYYLKTTKFGTSTLVNNTVIAFSLCRGEMEILRHSVIGETVTSVDTTNVPRGIFRRRTNFINVDHV